MSGHGEKVTFDNPVISWIDSRLPIFTMMHHEYRGYPMPKNCTYFWSFGAMAMVTLVIMIVTGLFLSMSYTPHTDYAFNSVERIMRDVNGGWLMRYVHMNGASMFFIVVYIHIFRGLYYGSYKAPREILWILGVIILLMMMGTAFMGYVLPWGQMSFWGATVITNLFSALPLVGDPIVIWLWGGFAVDNPTLNRFFSLHFVLPFAILGVVILHVAALHVVGSNNPTGVEPKSTKDTVPFHPYMTAKDGFAMILFFMLFAAFVFFAPNYLGHADNSIPANPLVTPAHIVPEWYFLPFYAILRAVTFDIFFIEAKLGGVIAMFGAIAVLFLLPWLDTSRVRSTAYRPVYKWFFWVLVIVCIFLGWLGAQAAEGWYVIATQICTAYYFFHFLILLPALGLFERTKPLPYSISEPVLSKAPGGGPLPSVTAAKPMEKA